MLQVVRIRVAEEAYEAACAEARRVTGRRAQTSSGLFGQCYVGKGLAAKVSSNVRTDGYLAWIKACAPIMGRNPHVPVVHKAIIFDDGNAEAGLFIMEALRESNRWQTQDGRDRAGDKFAGLFKRIVLNGPSAAPTPDLNEVAAIVSNLSRDYAIDLHGGNVMLRGTRWVVTDPVSFPNSNW